MGITRCGETRGKKSDTASTDMASLFFLELPLEARRKH